MDRFERELARMLRDSRQDTPYEDGHRYRLRAGIRARQRVRTAWLATASVLTLAGVGLALTVLPGVLFPGGPTGPRPRPATSAASASLPSTPRTAPAATGVLVPYRTSTPEPVPTRTSATRAAPRPAAGDADE
ncbi:cellulase [Streptomyces sp. ID05-39B]|uniref:cellulase n=1 Tax=Streptomyces sp. ID05-39B TaxID=3028664 RepID=UPI0029A8D8FE|nr:cellulase [Streptomyces sp. ID05-39B]MDX3526847.1 cellulase [Streptomyces sp. ID05-39B]